MIDDKRLGEIQRYLQDTTLGYEAPDGRKFAKVVRELLDDRDILVMATGANEVEVLRAANSKLVNQYDNAYKEMVQQLHRAEVAESRIKELESEVEQLTKPKGK